MLGVQEFRAAFPQFTAELFSDARVNFWLGLAEKMLNAARWGEAYNEGCFLYAAHFLTLERAANNVSDGTGGMAAAAGAVVSESKSVGGVSKSTGRAGAASTGDPAAAQWNDTIYGRQYWQMVKIFGAGGTVV